MSKRNDKWWLTLDETKDDLKNAHGFTYARLHIRQGEYDLDSRKEVKLSLTRNTLPSGSVFRLASNLAP